MILRKPYAFLIKNFKKINFVLLVIAIYVFSKTMALQGFTSNYAATGVYNELDLISNYINFYFIIALVGAIGLSSVLTYLLKYKDKPIKTYLLIIAEYLIILIILIFTLSFYNDIILNGYNKQMALVIRDLVFIFSIPQYAIVLLLLIRTIGLDLKNFGFNQDKDMLVSEEDREEVEVEVGFNKDKYKRKIRKFFRETGYFIKQNKIYLSIIVTVVTVFTAISIYNNIYLPNLVYKMNSNVNSNYYTFNIKNAYITDRDFTGNVIDEASTFVILNVDITNNVADRDLALNKFLLYVGNNYYVPNTDYNGYFTDMGQIYFDQTLDGGTTSNYNIVFKISKPKEDDNFLLKYQDVVSGGNLIRIKLKIQDISSFITKENSSIKNELTVPINLNDSTIIKFTNYSIGDNLVYNYPTCESSNDCFIKEGTINALPDKKIISISFAPINKTKNETITFINKYGKIRYKVDGKTYTESLVKTLSSNYNGNYIYYNVSNMIDSATNIEFVFTVRSYQYIYRIK